MQHIKCTEQHLLNAAQWILEKSDKIKTKMSSINMDNWNLKTVALILKDLESFKKVLIWTLTKEDDQAQGTSLLRNLQQPRHQHDKLRHRFHWFSTFGPFFQQDTFRDVVEFELVVVVLDAHHRQNASSTRIEKGSLSWTDTHSPACLTSFLERDPLLR